MLLFWVGCSVGGQLTETREGGLQEQIEYRTGPLSFVGKERGMSEQKPRGQCGWNRVQEGTEFKQVEG